MPPAYELLLLNTSIPQIQAAQSGDTYLCPRELAVVVNSSTDALRITQTGAGNALVVEDSANPDSTPFVVTAAGDVGIGTTSTSSARLSIGGTLGTIVTATRAVQIADSAGGGLFIGKDNSDYSYLIHDAAAQTSNWFYRGAVGLTMSNVGNLGLGVTPSTWGATAKAMQLSYASIRGRTDVPSSFSVAANSFWNGTNDIYIESGQKPTKYETFDGGHAWYTAGTGAAGAAISFTQAMTLDASGRLGIGETNPVTDIDILRASGDVSTRFRNGTGTGIVGVRSDNNFTELRAVSNHGIQFSANNAEVARITSGGVFNVGLGSASVATNQGIQLNPAEGYVANNATTGGGTSLILLYSSYSVANETKFEVTSEGNVKSRTNSYAGFSDARLKQNITLANTQWDDIKNIEVVKFQMKSEQFSDENNPWMLGVIAQQVETVSPGLVEEDPKDGMKTVKYSILYMKAVKALQEAMARIEKLEAEVAALKGA